jgi:hypothetical protein
LIVNKRTASKLLRSEGLQMSTLNDLKEKLGYLAPEVGDSSGTIDVRADLYSRGRVLVL